MSEDSASPRAAQPSQAPTTGACAWCGAAMELGPQARARFCCSGCEAAAAIVDEAGLDEWWRTREAAPPRPGGATGGWEQLPVQQAPDGSACATLRLDGLRCGSCVWLVERVLRATPGVEEAQVSYASGHTALRWRPEQVDLPQLCARIQTLGYTPRPADSGATPDHALLLRLGLASFAAMNVMMLAVSVYLGWWQGMDERYAALMRWASLILATPVVTWAAQPFFAGAWAGLRHRMLHMDLPISLGIGVLYGHGLWSTLRGQDAYLDSLTMLVALLLGGRLLEQRGRSRAAEAAASLAARAPRLARRVGAQGPEDVPAAELRVGDLVEVPAGGEVPADGVVEAGRAAARLALLTGESEPRELGPGEPVVTGAVLLDGSLRVRVQAVGDDTLLARMARGLRLAADRPAEPSPADQVAPWFTAFTLGAAALTFSGWALARGVDAALPVTISVLVVACPCALALAAPLANAAALGAAARRGLLFQGAAGLQRLARVDEVAFDKTGTLTAGEPAVASAEDEVLRLAAGLERNSLHPIARGIVAEAIRRGLPIPLLDGVQERPGVGIEGQFGALRLRLQREGAGVQLSAQAPGQATWEPRGLILLRDQARPDAAATVARLRAAGLRVALLSGDRREVAERIGAEAGVDEVLAEQDPESKARWLAGRQAQGHAVLFVGDGLNDGPALAAASASVAMGGGAASSVLVADAVVASERLGPVLAGVVAARAAQVALRRNLRRSLVYNVLAVALAMAGLVNPLVAALLMPASSALVIWGALGVERAVSRAVEA